MDVFPENVIDLINERLGGYNNVIGLRFVEASPDMFAAELSIDKRHLQPYGLVHGGVYAGMIESLCSTGAALSVWSEGKSTVGLENTTAFSGRCGREPCAARRVRWRGAGAHTSGRPKSKMIAIAWWRPAGCG